MAEEDTPEGVASGCFARIATMPQEEREALAVYRTHKHCKCPQCEKARAVLVKMDRKGARSWPGGTDG
jgi:hypothetical protein